MRTQRPTRRWFPPAQFYAEDLCTRCGICCGSTDGHPCEHLRRDDDGLWSCEIYEQRLGPHHTVDGLPFLCVAIRKVIEADGGYEECGYVRELRRRREALGQPANDLGRKERPE